ncbi:hypothetical protein ACTQ3T_14145 [Segatella copri]|uniref:hypothetical protein n=1 Tax=Segatella copri TaxID=165179 RepID=UPI003F99A9B5
MDETGTYINKKLCWFWCLQCPKFCYVFADESRGIQALKNHDVVNRLVRLILYTDRHGYTSSCKWRDTKCALYIC